MFGSIVEMLVLLKVKFDSASGKLKLAGKSLKAGSGAPRVKSPGAKSTPGTRLPVWRKPGLLPALLVKLSSPSA